VIVKTEEVASVKLPKAVTPVPPLATGKAVPDSVKAKVPLEVIGLPLIDKNEGTDIATEVTVPGLGVAITVHTLLIDSYKKPVSNAIAKAPAPALAAEGKAAKLA
jgi:hypothetical protein